MLDLAAVRQMLSSASTSDSSISALALIIEAWQALPQTAQPIDSLQWQGSFSTVYGLQTPVAPYEIIAVDGSQIYPNRHEMDHWSLIQVGAAYFQYGSSTSSVHFYQKSFVQQDLADQATVNASRTVRELEFGYELWQHHKPQLMLFDGSLACHHTAQDFKKVYDQRMLQFYDGKAAIISYTSKPYSRDMIRYIIGQAGLEGLEECRVIDAQLCAEFLPKNHRTAWFLGSQHKNILFCYLNTGYEIVRIELPHYLFEQADALLVLVLDQVSKGYGYPVSLSEAHEHTVVTEADRRIFCQLIAEYRATQSHSYKQLSKRWPLV